MNNSFVKSVCMAIFIVATAPLTAGGLFPNSVIKKLERDVRNQKSAVDKAKANQAKATAAAKRIAEAKKQEEANKAEAKRAKEEAERQLAEMTKRAEEEEIDIQSQIAARAISVYEKQYKSLSHVQADCDIFTLGTVLAELNGRSISSQLTAYHKYIFIETEPILVQKFGRRTCIVDLVIYWKKNTKGIFLRYNVLEKRPRSPDARGTVEADFENAVANYVKLLSIRLAELITHA